MSLPLISENKKFVAMNINFDSLFFPLNIDRKKYRDPSFFEVADRFFALSEKYKFKYSIFIIGRDLENPEVFARVREWSQAGHEIGNHTYTHETRLGTLPRPEMETEVLKSHEIITRCTGKEPRGFISPSWNVSLDLIDVLLKANYLYDTSVFPSYFIYLLLLKLKLLKGGRGGAKIVDTGLGTRGDGWAPLFASREPYFVTSQSLIEKQKDGLLMMPLPVTPYLRLPCWHTVWFALGKRVTSRVLKKCLKSHDDFYYLMHPRDYFDPSKDLDSEFIRQHSDDLSVFEGFNIPLRRKEDFFIETMKILSQSGRKFITLQEMAFKIKQEMKMNNH